MSEFSENTLTILRRAGWTEDRSIDTTAFEQQLRDGGYDILPTALEFLSRFGNLVIEYPNHIVPSHMSGASFDLLDVLETTSPDELRVYSKILDAPVTVVGMTRDNELLLMSDQGHVFDVFDAWMVEVGSSGEDAIEALCSGRELKKIPHPRGHKL